MHALRPVAAIAVFLLLTAPCLADGTIAAVRFPPSQVPGELIYGVTYTLWIPPEVTRLRGIIVHQHGCGRGACQGGATAAYDLHWQALARKWDCALLGPSFEQEDGQDCRKWCDPRHGSGARFLEALDQLATTTGHPELTSIPWCLWGHSGGGFWASLMQTAHPERIVAVWCRSGSAFPAWSKGEIEKPVIPDAAYRIPLVLNPGGKERGDARFNTAWTGSQDMFLAYRKAGALACFAPDPRTSHECGDARYLAIPFFDACLALRLPDPAAATHALRDIPAESGWLAPSDDPASGTTFSQFPGDRAAANWLPNESLARAWAEYVATGAVSDQTPPPAPHSVRLGEIIDGRRLITWDCQADLESGLRQFLIFRDGQLIGRVPEQPVGRFGRPLFQTMSYHDTPEQRLPVMAIRVPEATPGEYAVKAVNSVGLESSPTPGPAAR